MKRIVKKQLGKILLERGLVNKIHIDEVLKIQKKNGGIFGKIMVEKGYVSEKDIAEAVSLQYGWPYIDLENYFFDKEIVSLISKEEALKYSLLIVDRLKDIVTIAMSDPMNQEAFDLLKEKKICEGFSKLRVFISTFTDIKTISDNVYEEK